MSLSAGTRLGAYEILTLLGSGGMGEVYRARDTKLDREVAIKILPELFVSDPERVARFQREAKTLAALNHPHIGSIYGLDDAGGMHALVLELVEGPTLAERIAQGPIPLDEALSIARQIAEALETAHEQGIIHRDLKPANIKVRPDGVVKVLDFGLAKIGARDLVGQNFSQLATETADATRYGVILGTTVYMSPEQARGFAIDQRTDVWAFGCVLYEMLTGRSAFRGNTIPDTIAKILEREPDWQALPRSTPRAVRELIRRCVQKDPQHRFHGLAAARLQIDQAATHLRRRQVMGPLSMLAGATLALTIVAAIWWQPWIKARLIRRELVTAQQPQPAATQRDPVLIIVADLQNSTGDPAFDRSVEPMLKLALETASFISAYDHNAYFGSSVRRPAKLDDVSAREVALKGGLGVVLSGAIDRRGSGYEISLNASQTVTGKAIASAKAGVFDKNQTLGAVSKLVVAVRKALGDQTSDSAQLLAMKSVSTTSLEVAGLYAAAIDAQSNNKFEEAQQHLLKAVELQPNFGLGYRRLALGARSLGNLEDSEKYVSEALRHLDGMTERERFAVRGAYYYNSRDFQQCVKVYGELIAQFPADPGAHVNRSGCLMQLRKMREALDERRQALKIGPSWGNRDYLGLFAAYAGDFDVAAEEVRTMKEPTAPATIALAFAQMGQSHLSEAIATYQKLGTMGARGVSWSASGLGDLATYEGRFSEAVRIFEHGAAADLAASNFELAERNTERAARKLTSAAFAQVSRGQNALAIATAEKALMYDTTGGIRFLAARVFVQAGAVARARIEAARISLGTFVSPGLSNNIAGGPAAEPEAYAKIIEAEIALKNEDPRQAIRLLTEARALADTWLGHFDLGLAHLRVPAFAQAAAEFDLCLTRRGEAISLFFDEEPTYGFFPPVYFYQGVAREGLNRADFAESFRAYIGLRAKSIEDPLVREARRHAGQ